MPGLNLSQAQGWGGIRELQPVPSRLSPTARGGPTLGPSCPRSCTDPGPAFGVGLTPLGSTRALSPGGRASLSVRLPHSRRLPPTLGCGRWPRGAVPSREPPPLLPASASSQERKASTYYIIYFINNPIIS